MHQLVFPAVLGLAVLFSSALAQEESGLCSKPTSECALSKDCDEGQCCVSVYRLQNAPAADVASAINQWLEIRCNKECDEACCPTITEDVVTNSLLVRMSADCPESVELEKLISELDKRPHMVELSLCIKEKTSGKTKTICCPKIMAMDNVEGVVQVDSADESLIIEVMPRIICTETELIKQVVCESSECDNATSFQNACPTVSPLIFSSQAGVVGVDCKIDKNVQKGTAVIAVECEADIPFLSNVPYVNRLFKNVGLAATEVPATFTTKNCNPPCQDSCSKECYDSEPKHTCVERGIPYLSNLPFRATSFKNIGCAQCEEDEKCSTPTAENTCNASCPCIANPGVPFFSNLENVEARFPNSVPKCCLAGGCDKANAMACCDSKACCPAANTFVECPTPPVAPVGYFAEEEMASMKEMYDAMYELQVENERLQVEIEATCEMAEMMEEMWKLKAENAVLKAKLEMHQKHHASAYNPYSHPAPRVITQHWRSTPSGTPASPASVRPPSQPQVINVVPHQPKASAPSYHPPRQPQAPKPNAQPPKQTQHQDAPVFQFYSGTQRWNSAPAQSQKAAPATYKMDSGVVVANPNHPAAKQAEIKKLVEKIHQLQSELQEAKKQKPKSVR